MKNDNICITHGRGVRTCIQNLNRKDYLEDNGRKQGVDLIYLAQERVLWRAFDTTVMNFQVFIESGKLPL